jgi:2-iminobutanoate/2-iminopropanoate deaminase
VFEHPSSGPVFNELVEIYAVAARGPKDRVTPPGIAPQGASSPVLRAGGFVFVSAMTGRGSDGRLASGIAEQTRQTLENIRVCLEAAGSSLEKLVRVLVFLDDIRDLPAMDEASQRFLGRAGLPTRTAVQMDGPVYPELVMMEAVAAA